MKPSHHEKNPRFAFVGKYQDQKMFVLIKYDDFSK